MPNYKIIIEYDGRGFVGWQRQAAGRSVQGLLEEALAKVMDHAVILHGSGRTDAGVHARAQAASFESDSGRRPEQIVKGVNSLLPPDLAVLEATTAPENFHARFSAVGKIYDYDFSTHPTRRPLLAGRAWWVGPGLDWTLVEAALPHLAGEKDFASFRSLGSETKSTVRHIRLAALSRPEPALVRLTLEGNGFLRQMVRTVAGTLWLVGRRRLAPEDLAAIIAARDRAQAGPAAPPGGLYLREVLY